MNTIIRGAQVAIIIVTLIYCYRSRNKSSFTSYMQTFYLYPLVGSGIGIFWILGLLNVIPNSIFNYLNSISLIFHFAFLSLFIFKVLHFEILRLYLTIIFWPFVIAIIFFVIKDFHAQVHTPFAITNVGLFLFCVVFYFDLFRHLPTSDLLREPSFWIVTGVFCGVSFSIPIMLIGKYIFTLSQDLYRSVGWLAPFGYLIMYLFFIKAIQCSTQTPAK